MFNFFFYYCLGSPYLGALMSFPRIRTLRPIPLAARSKVWVCGLSLVGIAGSNPAGGMNICLVCCQVDVSASDWSLVQRSPTENGLSECDRESSAMRRPWLLEAVVYYVFIVSLLVFSIS